MINHSLLLGILLIVWVSPAIPQNCLADEDEQQPAIRTLAVGESVKVQVVSKQKFNPSGVKVKADEHYSFLVTKGASWKDATIVCDAGGWTTDQAPQVTRGFIQKSEKSRRVPAANWFELIGTVGANEDHHFQIGTRGDEWTYTPKVDGELFLFANDLISMYRNNHDSIEVTITRKEKRGKQQLPINRPKP